VFEGVALTARADAKRQTSLAYDSDTAWAHVAGWILAYHHTVLDWL